MSSRANSIAAAQEHQCRRSPSNEARHHRGARRLLPAPDRDRDSPAEGRRPLEGRDGGVREGAGDLVRSRELFAPVERNQPADRRTESSDVEAAELWPDRDARRTRRDRKSTRLNSSHVEISYAVFCLKKKTLTIVTV